MIKLTAADARFLVQQANNVSNLESYYDAIATAARAGNTYVTFPDGAIENDLEILREDGYDVRTIDDPSNRVYVIKVSW